MLLTFKVSEHTRNQGTKFPELRQTSTREEAKRKVSARDPIFGGSCFSKPLPSEDSNITGVPQAARKVKRAKIGGQKRSPKHKNCQNWGT